MNKIFIVIGECENVYQDEIGGPFVPHPTKEIVKVFANQIDAEKFVKDNKLKTAKRQSYGDTYYYKTRHLSLEIEEHFVETFNH